MILGNVNSRREAIVQLVVIGDNQQRQSIRAIVDTGFTGSLTLPPSLIDALDLTWYTSQEAILGDGSLRLFNVYEASIIWDGQVQTIEVNEADTEPLVGMKLLEGYELRIEAIAGGMVKIQALYRTDV